jgi:di/tricarboxylate transporter
MEWQAVVTLLTVVAVLGTLAATRIATDVVLMAALAFLMISGILTPGEALAGFSNPGVMTIATLYVVAAGLKETGAIQWIARRLLGQPTKLRHAQLRVLLPTAGLSAFMNNTTVVAMFIPAVQEWAGRLRLPPSKLLLPLSYAAILGGTCTLIGTSTNLVVDGLLQSEMGIHLTMFELAQVGVPLVVVGGGFLYLFADRLLPNRQGVLEQLEQAREYAVEVVVEEKGPLVGRTIQDAGLRSLTHGYLADIERDGRLLTAVPPDTVLLAGDILVFIGAPECARELRRIHGLRPAAGDVRKLDIAHHRRCLVEAVLAPDFAGLGQTVPEARFRSRHPRRFTSDART